MSDADDKFEVIMKSFIDEMREGSGQLSIMMMAERVLGPVGNETLDTLSDWIIKVAGAQMESYAAQTQATDEQANRVYDMFVFCVGMEIGYRYGISAGMPAM